MSAPSRRLPAAPPPDGGGEASVPWTPWAQVVPRVNKLWDPENTPHHSIIALTGGGKSYLGVNGILKPMCALDRVLIIDSKGDDPLVSSVGRPVKELPRHNLWMGNQRKKEPYDSWWRLEVSQDRVGAGRRKAQEQVFKALERVYREGNWVVYFDEIRDLTDPKPPNLGLNAHVDQIYRLGRSRHVSIIAATQAPRWVPASFYDQASFAWIGRIRDEQKQKRLLEIGGLTKSYLPIISGLERRQWFLSADQGEHTLRTKVE
jgi:hypothetical protein